MIGAIPIIAESRIREAMEQGQFGNLPGAGRPLDWEAHYDPDWWITRKLQRESLTPEDAHFIRERLRYGTTTVPNSSK